MNALDYVFGDRALNVAPDPQAQRFGSPCPCCGVEMHDTGPACAEDRCDTNCQGRVA